MTILQNNWQRFLQQVLFLLLLRLTADAFTQPSVGGVEDVSSSTQHIDSR